MLKWFALKVLNIQFRPDLMKLFALKSLNINFGRIFQMIFAADGATIVFLRNRFCLWWQMQDPQKLPKHCQSSQTQTSQTTTLAESEVEKVPSYDSVERHPPTRLDWPVHPHISLLPSQQGGKSEGKSDWSKLQPNHQKSQVFPKIWLPASFENSPPAPLLKGSKLFREVYQPDPNWSHFLSLVIPNNYKSEMH